LKNLLAAAAIALAFLPPAALAHGPEKHGKAGAPKALSTEEHPWGRQGDPARATRTVMIGMSDAMRFTPAEIRVKQGETIRFVVKNDGKAMHEMVIGTLAELKAHGELMKKFPNMEHDEPYMAHVDPGKSQEIVWTFTKAGEFHFGCLVPGHFDAGMIGRIVVAAK
jgi:uncharacterized cupredoxin-like copper-binding protein